MAKYCERGVSSAVASILLVFIAIVGSVMVYLWTSGYVSSSTTSSEHFGQASLLKIVAVEGFRGHVVVHVCNIGDKVAVVDRVYVENTYGEVVAVGYPISPNIIKPKETLSIIFNVNLFRDGKYRVRLYETSGFSYTSSTVYLKLASGIPPIVFSEAKLREEDANTIELYNPTSAPINITYFTIVIENPNWSWKRIVKIRILSTSTVYYEADGEGSLRTVEYIAPASTIIPPKGYLVFRGAYPSTIFDIANFTVKIVSNEGAIIDDAGGWLSAYKEGVDPGGDSLQRVRIIPPRWVFAEPTLGGPNREEGVEATT